VGIADKLAEMGLTLPPRRSVGSYVAAVQTGDLLFVSGGGPMHPDGSFVTGKVGGDVNIEDAQHAAKLCALYCLSSIKEAVGDLDRIQRVVKLLGFVNSAPGFSQQHVVMNGASDLLISLLGENGRHARSAVGVAELPMNISVEVEMIVQLA
jgi:enamine deaminase RidA (YjgF/YER057c/UK114 family)